MSGEEGSGSSQPRARSCTRSGGTVYDPDLLFPPYPKFQPVEKLPTNRSVICLVRHYLQCNQNREGRTVGGSHGVTTQMAIREVAKQVLFFLKHPY